MRSIWQGTLAFGLVSIPVKVYGASEDRDPRLHYLHRSCNAPVRYKKVCSACGAEVADDQLVLGHEYAPGQYVMLEKEELESLAPPSDRRVEILQFPRVEDLDAVYFLKPYYLEPQRGGQRAYQLLRAALWDSGRVALCRLALRQRPRLAALRPYHEGALMLETMHAPDEVRAVDDLDLGPVAVPTEPELHLAHALIETLAGPFAPQDHPDAYRQSLEGLLQRKVEVAPQPAEAPVGDDMNALLERLRLSVASAAAPY